MTNCESGVPPMCELRIGDEGDQLIFQIPVGAVSSLDDPQREETYAALAGFVAAVRNGADNKTVDGYFDTISRIPGISVTVPGANGLLWLGKSGRGLLVSGNETDVANLRP